MIAFRCRRLIQSGFTVMMELFLVLATTPSPDPNLVERQLTDTSLPIVQTSLGSLRGKTLGIQLDDGRIIRAHAFLSIPFARQGPRFAPALTMTPWQGILDVGDNKERCPSSAETGSENCHYLKILVPTNLNSLSAPVLFWSHGGGFSAGSSQDYNISAQMEVFISKGVIIVQPNYRVGALGFFTTYTQDAPGNYAFSDIMEALKFVKREINAFGGDPDRIILQGQGAGGVMSDFLTLNPANDGMYAGLCVMSLSAFSPLIRISKEERIRRNQLFASAVGCDTSNNSKWLAAQYADIVTCLKQKSVESIIAAQKVVEHTVPTAFWSPFIDEEKFGTMEDRASARPNVPVMMGTTHDETLWDLLILPALKQQSPDIQNPQDLNDRRIVRQQCIDRVGNWTYGNSEMIAKACEYKFGYQAIKGESVSLNEQYWIDQAAKVGSGRDYHAPIHKDISTYITRGNTNAYLYSFDYTKTLTPLLAAAKSFHNFDLVFFENFFIGGPNVYQYEFENPDKMMRLILGQLWTNFAKFSNPNGNPLPSQFAVSQDQTMKQVYDVTWEPLTSPIGYNYLSLTIPPRMENFYHIDNVQFWNEFVPILEALGGGASIATALPQGVPNSWSENLVISSNQDSRLKQTKVDWNSEAAFSEDRPPQTIQQNGQGGVQEPAPFDEATPGQNKPVIDEGGQQVERFFTRLLDYIIDQGKNNIPQR